jgi:superoxide dismutase, Fe-Mn family
MKRLFSITSVAFFFYLLTPSVFAYENLKDLLSEEAPFTLKPLPFSYDTLSPVLDEETMTLHHKKHHQSYIDKANKILENLTLKEDESSAKEFSGEKDSMKEASTKKHSSKNSSFHGHSKSSTTLKNLLENMDGYPQSLRNQVGGHFNHKFFWTLLSPHKKDHQIPSALKKALEKSFGSVESFKAQFEEAALNHFGSGWVWLIRDDKKSLHVVTTSNQDNPLMRTKPSLEKSSSKEGYPILGIDLWEHAYYIGYRNKRGDYLKNIWSIINWNQVYSYDKGLR